LPDEIPQFIVSTLILALPHLLSFLSKITFSYQSTHETDKAVTKINIIFNRSRLPK
jgi:hypothetical protein